MMEAYQLPDLIKPLCRESITQFVKLERLAGGALTKQNYFRAKFVRLNEEIFIGSQAPGTSVYHRDIATVAHQQYIKDETFHSLTEAVLDGNTMTDAGIVYITPKETYVDVGFCSSSMEFGRASKEGRDRTAELAVVLLGEFAVVSVLPF